MTMMMLVLMGIQMKTMLDLTLTSNQRHSLPILSTTPTVPNIFLTRLNRCLMFILTQINYGQILSLR